MRILQIGAGSMGTRRLRDLHQRQDVELTLLDQRPDRLAAAASRFGVAVTASLEEAMSTEPEALIISTPPDQHADYIRLALETGVHFFCEADIWTYDHQAIADSSRRNGKVAAPSCTLRFHPFVQELRSVVADQLGSLHCYGYLLSVDAPGWHPGEGAEYYARHEATAPAREMVPFELIALHDIFGPAVAVAGRVTRRGLLDVPGPDSFSLQMQLQGGATGQLSVIMASPRTARQGWAAGDSGVLRFDLLAGTLQVNEQTRQVCDWREQYEPMYAREMSAFLSAVRGEAPWPYDYASAADVCATLAAAERSMLSGRVEAVDPSRQPAALPGSYVV